uniref:Long-chain-fatty-acid--CoA ligase n=1 Tax=Phallusia mammillata TaxID=59560 RepID=A0A6F9D696_9ASCI|nr:long-chain-fatty-acid--CoA ligase 1 [Phallusia mammillata]
MSEEQTTAAATTEDCQQETENPAQEIEGANNPEEQQEEKQAEPEAQQEEKQPEPEAQQAEKQAEPEVQQEEKQAEPQQQQDQRPEQTDVMPKNGSAPQTEEGDPLCRFKSIPLSEFHLKQTVPVEGSDGARASPCLYKGQIIHYLEPEVRTLHDVFLRGLKASKGGPCVGWRPGPDQGFKWLTYQQVLDRVQHFGSGLLLEGATSDPSQFIGIFSQNRVEWKVVEQACNSYSMVIVTLYDTLGPAAIEHIVKQCELQIIVVDKNPKLAVLLKGVQEGKYSIKLIVAMETIDDDNKKLADECGVKVMTFSEVEENGKANLKDFVPPKPDDLNTICYTSGTTGQPKGVMLTHGNIVANQSGVYGTGKKEFMHVDNNDVYISYLPLAHIFERLLAVQMQFVGASMGYYQGNVKLLLDDIAVLRPTCFPMVPRLVNRIYDKIHAGVAGSAIKKFLLDKAHKSKLAKLKKGVVTRSSIWDSLVFKKVQNLVGGRVKFCITGAAPVSTDVLNFMRCALGVYFTEGYGQTEATAGIAISVPGDYYSGSVGTPTLSNYVKLVDVPEKNYFAKEGVGEICAKGPNIFQGYYKNEEKTKEALDEDGWLHTGDVGKWLPNGSLKIIDRKKHIFKQAQGEYIAPEKIEQVLVQSAAVGQAFVYGESLKATLIAIVIPDPEALCAWCSSKGENGSYEELCGKESVNKLILDDICALGKLRGLHSFEIPKKIHLDTELFSVENDLLTPTFKSKRPQIEAKYKVKIGELYKDVQ